VDDAVITGAALVGLVVGGVLDPVGQRLADLSRAQDERRRAERDRREAEDERTRLGGQVPTAPAPTSGSMPWSPPGAPPGPVPASRVPELPLEPVPGDPLTPAALPAGTAPPGTPRPGTAPVEPDAVGHLLPAGRSPLRTAAAALVTGLLFAAAASHFGRHLVLAPFCAFFAVLVAVSVTDLSHRLVPRWLVYAGLTVIVPLLVATSAVDHTWGHLSGAAIAGAVAFGGFFTVWWFVPRGMGFGDVRLAGLIGVAVGYLSLLHAYIAFLSGFVAGLVFGLAVMATTAGGRRTRIPFAPSLALGGVVGVLWGGHIAQAFFPVGS
jgi:prepilin signal peptidase PulO-like enzyme (type II secretory pathway)